MESKTEKEKAAEVMMTYNTPGFRHIEEYIQILINEEISALLNTDDENRNNNIKGAIRGLNMIENRVIRYFKNINDKKE